ncbi:MAG TPA: P1 family peptidase [Vicinamibacterales bacterium]|nr:P1 family peptidase [Vicinamibacterales bacterium]
MKAAIALTVTAAAVALAVASSVPSRAQSPSMRPRTNSKGLTAVAGLKVGHHTLTERPTGCTVVLVEGEGAVGGISQRGAAPGTRETDLLDPLNMVERVNAIVLTGGSAYGLDAAQGVVRYLEEKKIGYPIAGTVVPIVPAAVLMDLGFGGSATIRPTADCGYRAVSSASDAAVAEGNIGAGAGATVGKSTGRERAMKAGIGSAAIVLESGLVVAAIVAVNAIGDIIDPTTGAVVAGVRTPDGKRLADARVLLRSPTQPAAPPRAGENTTIAVVATNARLTKTEVNRVALMADDGLARAVNPAHTLADGDTVFSLATARWQGQADVTTIGALAAEALSEAIVRAATQAVGSGGLPSARELGTVPARFR